MRRKLGRGRLRRLRAGLVTSLPGGLGTPSVPTKRDRLLWLDAARKKGGESCPHRGPQGLRPRPEVTAPGTEKPRWSAAGRASFAKDAHAARRELNGCASRRSIPSGLPEGQRSTRRKPGETTAHPAPQRIGAMALGYALVIPGPAQTRRPGITKSPSMQCRLFLAHHA